LEDGRVVSSAARVALSVVRNSLSLTPLSDLRADPPSVLLMVLAYEYCFYAAEQVLEALSEIGETWSCLIGGMAARLHGVSRHVRVRIFN
jgi:hypothetical protein